MSEITIDARGRHCPLPIIILAQRIDEVSIGECVRLLADDPAAAFDVPAWCRMTKHQLVSVTDGVFVIERTA